MENYISAIKSNDLIKAKKAFNAIMLERTAGLIEEQHKVIAQSILIEGEEPEEDEDDEDGKEDKSDGKDKKIPKEKSDEDDEDDEDE